MIQKLFFEYMNFSQLTDGPIQSSLRLSYHQVKEAGYLKFFDHPNVKLTDDGKMDINNQHDVIISSMPICLNDKWKGWVKKYNIMESRSEYTLQDIIRSLEKGYDQQHHEVIGVPFFTPEKLEWMCDNLRYIAIHGIEKHTKDGKHMWDYDTYIRDSKKLKNKLDE